MKRPPITVHVEQLDEPIDLEAWAREYVAAVLELEGIHVPSGPPPEDDGTMAPTVPLHAARSR